MSSCSAASRREAPPSTRAITRMRMSAEYAFGMVRPPDESMPPDSPIYRPWEFLRFYSARTCSRLSANPENCYHPLQFGVHSGNPDSSVVNENMRRPQFVPVGVSLGTFAKETQ